MNQNKLITEIVEAAQKSLETSLTNNGEEIQNKIFQSALRGLAKGSMTYENDPLITIILQTIKSHVAKVQNLTAAEYMHISNYIDNRNLSP